MSYESLLFMLKFPETHNISAKFQELPSVIIPKLHKYLFLYHLAFETPVLCMCVYLYTVFSMSHTLSDLCPYFQYKTHEEKRYAHIEAFDNVDAIEPIGNEIDTDIGTGIREWDDNIAQPASVNYVNYPQRRYFYGMGFPQQTFPEGAAPLTGFLQSRYPVYAQTSYSQVGYPQTSYPQGYSQTSYPQGYPQTAYPQAAYSQRYPPFDLSRDTYVNEIAAQSGMPTNPDAEVFGPNMSPARANSRFRYPR